MRWPTASTRSWRKRKASTRASEQGPRSSMMLLSYGDCPASIRTMFLITAPGYAPSLGAGHVCWTAAPTLPSAAPCWPATRAERLSAGSSWCRWRLTIPGAIRCEARRKSQALQLVLSDRSPLTEGREFSVLSPQSWRLADLGAKHALLKEGIGWGNMPRHTIAADLVEGRLCQLDLPERPGADYTLSALWRRDARPRTAASWLIDAMRDALKECAD